MKKLFRRKTLFDRIAQGRFDDRVLARRMMEWMKKGNESVASRAIRLYEKQSEEKLETKNSEIEGIKTQLASIDRESRELQANMDAKIQERELELEQALNAALEEEKKKLFSALTDYLVSKGFASDVALNLIGNVYTLTHEEPWTSLRDAREFTVTLNSTGRMDKAGLGIAICMGDRGKCFEEATVVMQEYRRTITKYLSWVTEKPERLEELESIYVVRGDGVIDEKVISPVSSILSISLSKLGKPIIVYSAISGEDMDKVSARALEPLRKRGLNLGEVLRVASEKYSGRGGGHDVAAGAQISIKDIESFIKLVDQLVKKQLEEAQLGS